MTDNRWIVSSHRFVEHASPGLARNEMNRLQELHPKKKFRMYRIKRVLVEEPEQTGESTDA